MFVVIVILVIVIRAAGVSAGAGGVSAGAGGAVVPVVVGNHEADTHNLLFANGIEESLPDTFRSKFRICALPPVHTSGKVTINELTCKLEESGGAGALLKMMTNSADLDGDVGTKLGVTEGTVTDLLRSGGFRIGVCQVIAFVLNRNVRNRRPPFAEATFEWFHGFHVSGPIENEYFGTHGICTVDSARDLSRPVLGDRVAFVANSPCNFVVHGDSNVIRAVVAGGPHRERGLVVLVWRTRGFFAFECDFSIAGCLCGGMVLELVVNRPSADAWSGGFGNHFQV